MDFNKNRYDEEFIYRRLSWNSWIENLTYNYITGGSIEFSNDASLKVTGKFSFTGYELPNEEDLVRVYYRFKDESGESQEMALATLFTSYSSVTYNDTLNGLQATGSLNAESVLSVLNNEKIGYPLTIKKATLAISKVREIIEERNLKVNVVMSPFVLTSDYTFKESDTILTVVNTLLSMADYKDAYPDAYGVIQIEPRNYNYDSITFKNDKNSIMYPEIENENQLSSTPNVVKLFMNTDSASILAVAKNLSGSKASLEARGNREVTYVESVSNVGSGNYSSLLKKKAEEVLKEKSSTVEYVKFQHAWVPMKLNDVININYGDFIWAGNLDNYSIELSPAVKTTSKVKRVLTEDVVITSTVEVYR